ncbi:hypothetical protein ANI_1_254084 [Paecilomyces variotii No. 5]|uniref:Rhodopsin domain-containing protein n=1 Tax=Byssochlamys spectabilis (strain No. 5 / NBRC 109023) TaxID=1356009 RepID=V5FY84_BYSSN|nr:hypothetical protein ANI_1_254084 [Paecilomyces variotii No. 5]
MSSKLTQEKGAAWSQTGQPTLLGVSLVFLILTNFAVPARIWAQRRAYKKVFSEDYLLIIALLFTDVVTITTLLATHYGFGLHLQRVDPEYQDWENLDKGFICEWISAVGNELSLGATQVALLLYYRRLFMVNQRWLRVLWWFNFFFVLMWTVICTLFYISECTPMTYYWEQVNPHPNVKGLRCLNRRFDVIAVPLIVSVISDFTIMLLPVLTVSTLSIKLSRNLALAAVFCAGMISFAFGLARVITEETSTSPSSDATSDIVSFQLLNVVELNMAVICACVVPVYAQLRLMISGSSKTNSSYKPESRGLELRPMAIGKPEFSDDENK